MATYAVDGDVGQTVEPVSIRFDTSLLASAPERIAIPSLIGGDTEWVQKTGFEEREDGFVWYGGPEGGFPIHHSHVVLTSKGGWTVGAFLSGDRWYEIRANSEGGGVVTADSTDEPPHWCGATVPPAPALSPPPAKVAVEVEHGPIAVESLVYDSYAPSRIDFLISVSKKAAEYFEAKSSVDAEVQALIDYANLVLKNTYKNRPDDPFLVKPILNPVAVVGDLFDDIDGPNDDPYGLTAKHINRLHSLRREYDADLVHIITKNRFYAIRGVCGVAPILLRGETARKNVQWSFAITDVGCDEASPGRAKRTFIHELGHNFGLNHNVETGTANDRDSAFGKGRKGYGWLSNPWAPDTTLPFEPIPTADKPGAYTIMAYKPRSSGGVWHSVPFFSSASKKIRPGRWGMPSAVPQGTRWKLGHKKLAHSIQTIPEAAKVVAAYSDYQFRLSKAPRNLRITDSSKNTDVHTITYHLEWADESADEMSFEVHGDIYTKVGGLSGFVKDKHLYGFTHKRFAADTEQATVTWPLFDENSMKMVEENMVVLSVAAINLDGMTWSEEVIAPVIVSLPRAPVLGKPTFSWRDWCVTLDVDKANTERIKIWVQWEDQYQRDYGSKTTHHPGNLDLFCHQRGGTGFTFDIRVTAINSKGQTASDLMTFKVPYVRPALPAVPVLGDHVFDVPASFGRARNPGEWCLPIEIDESNTATVWIRVGWKNGRRVDHDWYERRVNDSNFDRGKTTFCFDGDIGDNITIYARAWSMVDYQHRDARRSQSKEKRFHVDR